MSTAKRIAPFDNERGCRAALAAHTIMAVDRRRRQLRAERWRALRGWTIFSAVLAVVLAMVFL